MLAVLKTVRGLENNCRYRKKFNRFVIVTENELHCTAPPSRRLLLGKLKYYDIRNNLLKWSESFLVGRFQSVPVDEV